MLSNDQAWPASVASPAPKVRWSMRLLGKQRRLKVEDLIKALQIFLKYANPKWPTHCSHDQLAIMEVEKEQVREEDLKELERLGFFWCEEDDCFVSYRFGSA